MGTLTRSFLFAGFATVLLPVSAMATTPALPQGQCDISQTPTCSTPITAYDSNGVAITPTPIDAVRSSPGQAGGPIDVWGICRYVDNISGNLSFFVPFKSSTEWIAFKKNAPTSQFDLVHCARPTTMTIGPDSQCPTPTTPASQTARHC